MTAIRDPDPPDYDQCEAHFQRPLGGIVRCTASPMWVAFEATPGPDGRHHRYSLCAACEMALPDEMRRTLILCSLLSGPLSQPATNGVKR